MGAKWNVPIMALAATPAHDTRRDAQHTWYPMSKLLIRACIGYHASQSSFASCIAPSVLQNRWGEPCYCTEELCGSVKRNNQNQCTFYSYRWTFLLCATCKIDKFAESMILKLHNNAWKVSMFIYYIVHYYRRLIVYEFLVFNLTSIFCWSFVCQSLFNNFLLL